METHIAGDPAPINDLETPKTNINPLKKLNPKLLGIIVVVVLLGALAYYFKNLWIAATVDGHIINRLAVIKKLEKQSGKSALDALIDDQLISNEARKKKITISNDDVSKKLDTIKSQVAASGGTLEAALTTAGMTLDDLKKQIMLQLKLEKLLGDKLNVTEEELNKYITDSKVTLPTGKEAETKDKIRNQLKSQKFNTEASKYLVGLRGAAKINTYVSY
ncbi:MAG TPA: SurA N-terminal domain-containing protein [Patescibacteria group bacterium]